MFCYCGVLGFNSFSMMAIFFFWRVIALVFFSKWGFLQNIGVVIALFLKIQDHRIIEE